MTSSAAEKPLFSHLYGTQSPKNIQALFLFFKNLDFYKRLSSTSLNSK
jgi:hypothetical protein